MSAKPGEVAPGDDGVPPEWASGAAITDPTSGQLSYVEPPAGVKGTGFVPYRVKPARNWANWVLRQLYLWQQYLDATAQRSATVVVAASNASADSRRMADYVCDGVADDVQIAAAIAALPAADGVVYLTEGTFTLAAGIALNAGQGIRGAGTYATLLRPTALQALDYDILAMNDRCSATDFSINGTNGVGVASHTGIRANARDEGYIARVNIESCLLDGGAGRGHGIYLTDCTDYLLDACRISSCAVTALKGDEPATTNKDVTIRDLIVGAGSVGGSQVEWEVSGSSLENLQATAAGAGFGLRLMGGENIRVLGGACVGHVFNGLLIDAAAAQILVKALTVDGSGTEGIISSGDYVTLDACHVFSAGTTGIAIAAGQDPTVQGCRVLASVGNGITTLAPFSQVLGNRVTSAGLNGIYVGAGADESKISGNKIRNSQHRGIYVTACDFGQVTENYVYESSLAANNTYDDILIDDAIEVLVSNNRMHNLAAAARCRYPLNLTGAATIVAGGNNHGRNGASGGGFVTAGTYNPLNAFAGATIANTNQWYA